MCFQGVETQRFQHAGSSRYVQLCTALPHFAKVSVNLLLVDQRKPGENPSAKAWAKWKGSLTELSFGYSPRVILAKPAIRHAHRSWDVHANRAARDKVSKGAPRFRGLSKGAS